MKHLSLLLALFCVLPNCSAYRSPDRDNFEKNGPPSVIGTQKPTHPAVDMISVCTAHLESLKTALQNDTVGVQAIAHSEDQNLCRISWTEAEAQMSFDCWLNAINEIECLANSDASAGSSSHKVQEIRNTLVEVLNIP